MVKHSNPKTYKYDWNFQFFSMSNFMFFHWNINGNVSDLLFNFDPLALLKGIESCEFQMGNLYFFYNVLRFYVNHLEHFEWVGSPCLLWSHFVCSLNFPFIHAHFPVYSYWKQLNGSQQDYNGCRRQRGKK